MECGLEALKSSEHLALLGYRILEEYLNMIDVS